MRPTGFDACQHKTNNLLTTHQHTTSSRSTRSEVIEWGGTQSEDGGGVEGVALGWVIVAGVVLGFVCVRMVGGHVGVVRMSQDGSE